MTDTQHTPATNEPPQLIDVNAVMNDLVSQHLDDMVMTYATTFSPLLAIPKLELEAAIYRALATACDLKAKLAEGIAQQARTDEDSSRVLVRAKHACQPTIWSSFGRG